VGDTEASTTSALSVPWPAAASIGDLGIIVHETSGGSGDVAAPSGWAAFTGSPVTSVADATGTKLSVFWKVAISSDEANVSLGGVADHSVARLYVFRNTRSDIAPGVAITTDAKTIASSTLTFPSIDTLAYNTLVLCIASRSNDASTLSFSTFVNANLGSTSTAGQAGTLSGNGGGFVVFVGTKATPGATGTSTASVASSVNAMMVLGLEPSVALPA
jgi:hypothetical protein